jgi:DHA1 family tetracycline resistance protein-like MFS transporter
MSRLPKSSLASRQAAVPFILVTVLFDVLGFGLIIPVLPALVGQFAQDPASQSYWYGLLSAVYGLMQFVCAPLLGALSDRFGRRPVILISVFGLGLDFLLLAFAPSLTVILLARVIGGATAANFSVANAYIADVTSGEERARSFGLIGAAFGVGFILGPVIGGFLAVVDLRLPFFFASGLAALNWCYGYFVLPESLPAERRSRFKLANANPFAALRGLARLQGVGGLVGVYAFSMLAQFVLYAVWVLYGTFRFGWGPEENGASLFMAGVVSAVVQGGLLGMLLRRWGEMKAMQIGFCSAVVAYICYGLAQQSWVMYCIIFGNFLAAISAPAIQGLISKAVDPKEQGVMMGALTSINSVTMIVAPLIGAPMLAEVSNLPKSDWRIGSVFFVCAGLQAIAWLLALRLSGRKEFKAA